MESNAAPDSPEDPGAHEEGASAEPRFRHYLYDASDCFVRTLLRLSLTVWAVPVVSAAGFFAGGAVWELLPISWAEWLYDHTSVGVISRNALLLFVLWWPIVAFASWLFLWVDSMRARWWILTFLFSYHFVL
ncbi:MAG: hypothetical protein ACFB20_09925 [Opitutales bacterium]